MPIVRRIAIVVIAGLVAALAFGPAASAKPIKKQKGSAATTVGAATLADYWAGSAEWELYEFYPKTQYAHDPGDGGYGAGPMIRVGPDGSWNFFTRTLWIPGGDCSEQTGFSSGTVMRRSTDRGRTWSEAHPVVLPTPNTPWSCGATDGDAYFDGTRWHYLFQCQAHAGDTARGGPFWNICHIANNGPDATTGWIQQPDENPVMGDYPGGYSPWAYICDQPTDRCSELGGGPGGVKQAGTPSIFEVPAEPGWFFIDIHGINQDLTQEQRGHQFVGVIKTQDFKTFVAGGGSNLPTDAIFGPDDAREWLEPTPGWSEAEIGGGGGAVHRDPNDGLYYHVVEASNGGGPGFCFQATAMDIGILRAPTPAATVWEQPSQPGRQNPIFYSQDLVSDDYFPIRCSPSYESLFHDPATGETFLVFFKRNSEDDAQEGVYVFRLAFNLLKNANAWRCIDVAPWQLADPTALATDLAIRRDGVWSSDGQCHFATRTAIVQEVELAADRTFSTVGWGGKFAARVSSLYPPSGFLSAAGSGAITVQLSQIDSAGGVITTDVLEVNMPAELAGAYPDVPWTSSSSLAPGAVRLRYVVDPGSNPLLTVLADEMFVRAG